QEVELAFVGFDEGSDDGPQDADDSLAPRAGHVRLGIQHVPLSLPPSPPDAEGGARDGASMMGRARDGLIGEFRRRWAATALLPMEPPCRRGRLGVVEAPRPCAQ